MPGTDGASIPGHHPMDDAAGGQGDERGINRTAMVADDNRPCPGGNGNAPLISAFHSRWATKRFNVASMA